MNELKEGNTNVTIIYCEGVPEQVIEELSETQKVQYFIWDAIIKRMAMLHPTSLLPVIKEIFDKKYLEETKIEFLSTEYSVEQNFGSGGSILHSIRADLVVKINDRDVYHLECQIAPKGDMMFRMYEYDSQIALIHGVRFYQKNQKSFLEMPKSCILYLTHTRNTPDVEIMQIRIPDGSVWEYKIPTLKVQNYTLEMIKKKQLYFILPLTTIRYYNRKTKRLRENDSKPFVQFLKEAVQLIREAVHESNISVKEGEDILDFLHRGCQYLFAEDPNTLKGVREVMEPIFKLGREIFEEEATKRITHEVTEKVTKEITEQVTQQVTQQITEQTIKEFIVIEQQENTASETIRRKLLHIFHLSEEMADEKMKLYYK